MTLETTILDDMMKNYLIFMVLIFCCASCDKKEKFLKGAIKWDADICPLVYTEDSEIILICTSARRIVEDLEENFDIVNGEEYVYNSLKEGKAIHISKKIFEDARTYCRIYPDSEMEHCYNQFGVEGLFDKYFKKDDYWPSILWNSEEMFVIEGHEPYPAYGEDHNTNYMAYLLSKHDIYLIYTFIEHIPKFQILYKYSDMKPYINKKKSIKR